MDDDRFRQVLMILIVKGIISVEEFDEIMSLRGYHVDQYIGDKMERV